MNNDMVMRSVYLRLNEDSKLRQLAHDLNVTKSDLIRSAINVKLRDWLESNSTELVLRDLECGRRESAMNRAAHAAEKSPSSHKAVGKHPAKKPSGSEVSVEREHKKAA
jgi:hypothetical protein